MATAPASPAPFPDTLAVFWDRQRVGTLYRTEPLSFSYESEWLASAGEPLGPGLPLGSGRYDSPRVHAFFENLLPEGEQRRLITLRNQVTTVYGLLAATGGDAAGAVVLLPEGQAPAPPQYQHLTWSQVNALIHVDETNLSVRQAIEKEARDYPAPRLSISGAQMKMLLSLDAQGKPELIHQVLVDRHGVALQTQLRFDEIPMRFAQRHRRARRQSRWPGWSSLPSRVGGHPGAV